jgi:folate-binding protein YgfZ
MIDPTFQGGAVRLSHWGVIRAQGADAASFLHGQLTQDVTALPAHQARPAGYCSAKGRLLASFVMTRPDRDTVELLCSADLLAPTLKRLSMFVLRAKCKMSDASAELAVWGLAGPAAQACLGDSAPAAAWGVQAHGASRVLRLPDAAGQARFLVLQAADQAAPALPALDVAAWDWLEVQSGVARITAATVEQFVPQMVNLELVGGVNFQKGCYPGQEVVARSQYRGTLKRRSLMFTGAAAAQPGQEVFAPGDPDQPAGMVVLAAARPGQAGTWDALVEVKLGLAEQAGLHLGSATGPGLQPATLPYAIPSDQA